MGEDSPSRKIIFLGYLLEVSDWLKYMVRKPKRSNASKNLPEYAGIHIIAEFWGGNIIEDVRKIRKILIESAKRSKNTCLGVKIHKFSPCGITGFILLAESHISIHTWPELNYVAIDIFSCGTKTEPRKGLEYLKENFQPTKIRVKEIKRGV